MFKYFKNIERCLNEYEEACKKCYKEPETEEEKEALDFIEYFDLHLAKAIMSDLQYCDKGEKVAKIILAMLRLSNEVKIKIE